MLEDTMYYIWSLLISIVIFIIVMYIEKQNKEKENIKYEMISLSNLLIFGIIYLVSTIICFFVFSNNTLAPFSKEIKENLLNNKYEKIEKYDSTNNIDPLILKKIPDNFNIGFEPFNEETE